MIRIMFACCLALLMACNSSTSTKSNTVSTPFNEPPAWAAEAIWYQVFVERFSNGDSSNDPTAASIAIPPIGVQAPAGWHISKWTGDG